jgi:hypothetical protein
MRGRGRNGLPSYDRRRRTPGGSRQPPISPRHRPWPVTATRTRRCRASAQAVACGVGSPERPERLCLRPGQGGVRFVAVAHHRDVVSRERREPRRRRWVSRGLRPGPAGQPRTVRCRSSAAGAWGTPTRACPWSPRPQCPRRVIEGLRGDERPDAGRGLAARAPIAIPCCRFSPLGGDSGRRWLRHRRSGGHRWVRGGNWRRSPREVDRRCRSAGRWPLGDRTTTWGPNGRSHAVEVHATPFKLHPGSPDPGRASPSVGRSPVIGGR